MKAEIHYEEHGLADMFIVYGDDIEQLRNEANREIKKRGLDMEKNNVYSICDEANK